MYSEKIVPLFIWIVCLFGDLFVFFQFHTSHSNPIWIQYNGGFDSLEASQKEKHPVQDYLKWKSWNVFVRVRWVLIFLSITYSSIHLKSSLRHCCQADNKLYIYSLSVKFLVPWLSQFKPAIAPDSTATTNFLYNKQFRWTGYLLFSPSSYSQQEKKMLGKNWDLALQGRAPTSRL